MDSKMNLKNKTLDARSWQQAEFDEDKGLVMSKDKSALKKQVTQVVKGLDKNKNEQN